MAASASGYVSYLAPLGQYNGGYGNYVVVNHGAGWTSLYAHLRGYAVSQNQAVTRGDIVGFVGSTGNSTGNHLHFEQRRNGSPQPVRYSGGSVIAGRQYQSDNCANSTPPPHDDDSGDDGGSSQLAQTIGERATATGDFDGDGFDDLAIGSPGENSGVADSGFVHLIYGSATGLNARVGGLRQGSGLGGADEAGDYLGSALATGDFDGDGFADLAIGSPGENSGVADSGFVHLIFGSATGLNARPGGLRQGSGLGGADEAGDYLGSALATGDFDGDGFADLAIGTPGENSGVADSGFVHLIFGSATGLNARSGGLRQGSGLGNADEAGDYLGAALASGDFDRDGFADLAIGSPGENSGVADGGFVHAIFGSVTGLNVSRTTGFRQGNGLGGADEAGDYLGGGFPGERFW